MRFWLGDSTVAFSARLVSWLLAVSSRIVEECWRFALRLKSPVFLNREANTFFLFTDTLLSYEIRCVFELVGFWWEFDLSDLSFVRIS